MVQFDRVVLVLENDGRTGVFELRNNLRSEGDNRRNFLISGRGGVINELLALLDEDGDSELDSRESFFLDGGLGEKDRTFSAELISGSPGGNAEPLQMGDGSSDPEDPDDVTKWDATGSHALSQWQILDWWLSETRTDSDEPAEIHWGEWSDGTYVDEGVFGRPIEVVVSEWSVRRDPNEPSTCEVTLTVQNASTLEAGAEALEDEGR